MQTEILREYNVLFDETMLALTGITTYPQGWKLHGPEGRIKADTDAVDDLRRKWFSFDTKSLKWELKDNLLSVADKDKLIELYRERFSPKIIEDIEGIDLTAYDDCENKDEFIVRFIFLCEEFNDKNKALADAIKPLLMETPHGVQVWDGIANDLSKYITDANDKTLSYICQLHCLPTGVEKARWKGNPQDAGRFAKIFGLKPKEFNSCFCGVEIDSDTFTHPGKILDGYRKSILYAIHDKYMAQ